MSKRNKYSAGMLGAALIVGIGIGFCGGFVTGNRLGSKSAAKLRWNPGRRTMKQL